MNMSYGEFVKSSNISFLKTIVIYLGIGFILGVILDIVLIAIKILYPERYNEIMQKHPIGSGKLILVCIGIILVMVTVWPSVVIDLVFGKE